MCASFFKPDSTNLIQDNYNSTRKYSFPGSAADFKDVVCAVESISMYNSEYNTDATQFYNNSFKIEVPIAGTTSTVSTALVNAGAYLINPSGENVLTKNNVYYATQIDFSAAPTTLPTAGGTWTCPASGLYSSGGTDLPTTTRVPRLFIDNAAFGKVVGLTTGTYPSAPATVSSAQLSNIIPQIHPTSSYIARCDLIKNEYVVSGDILSAFDRGDAKNGQLISY
ncbi:uncharacterized protein PHALS_09980 [Plasmopara halstedii]|uniref:Uncharacterized protein n=1 Tax=Plasmopara halstedii TaxID=4781 RepID=A0A0P1AGI1_PLAHL|nr:uncharacterized protein PHALS_09980 [Plasmopara halstedii]CEG39744.1 hypothetical protein PHALS_09980 [Plasmopara halstedii]|eukprot:XP_024576113.1 hypothetical protein PHALS_09980 [Plasmopara halstedii]